jgi:outer membrane lipoprotein carrier protein
MIVGLPGLLVAGLLAQPAAAEGLIQRVLERTRRTTSLSADFVQTYRSAALGRELVERGTLKIKRPGRMLWEYQEPEKKTFVSDGKTFYFYVPAERQVIVREQSGERGVAVALLSGEAGVLSQFHASAETEGGKRRVKLVPKKPDPELERAYLELDADARIVGIEIWDAQGNNSRFRFDKLRENVLLDDRLFRFSVPKGVTVIGG